jgi:hypothetical protein
MWTIKIHGEVSDTFFAMLQALSEGYVVSITHGEFTGDATFVAVEPRSITVRPYDTETNSYRVEPCTLGWEGLDEIEVW